jgi:hypothetical protein
MDAFVAELQKLYDSRIPFSIAANGRNFSVRIGGLDSPVVEASVPSLDSAAVWLREQAKHRYPASEYLKAILTSSRPLPRPHGDSEAVTSERQ